MNSQSKMFGSKFDDKRITFNWLQCQTTSETYCSWLKECLPHDHININCYSADNEFEISFVEQSDSTNTDCWYQYWR